MFITDVQVLEIRAEGHTIGVTEPGVERMDIQEL